MLWDENSNAHIVDVYSDVDVSGLRDDVRAAYPGEAVRIEAEEGKVVAIGKVSSKAVGRRRSANGKFVLQERCRFPDDRTQATKNRSC